MSKDDILKEIKEYVGNDDYSKWYVGITNDINRRLFQEHGVNKDSDCGGWCEANSKADAQTVEEYFLNAGMDGDTGGGNDDSTYVYVFRKNSHTDPRD
jgi:hypothetical protein